MAPAATTNTASRTSRQWLAMMMMRKAWREDCFTHESVQRSDDLKVAAGEFKSAGGVAINNARSVMKRRASTEVEYNSQSCRSED